MLAVIALASPGLSAQDEETEQAINEIHRPSNSNRLAHRWDFEDAEETLEAMPRNWFRSLHNPNVNRNPTWRPGFPRFNESQLTEDRSWEGNWSFMLPTLGGSTSAMLARGVAPVQPDADLLVSVMVFTEGLEHARARVVARLLDLQNNPIEGAAATSEPILSEGAWRRVSFEIAGVPEAVSLQIELQVLQSSQMHIAARLPGVVLYEDVNGRAYFDDLRVYQVPRVELTTEARSNLTLAPDEVQVSLRVRDLVGVQLHADLLVYDRHARVVDTYSEPVSSVPRPIEWKPALKEFGWYRVAVSIRDDKGVVGHSSCDFAWLGELNKVSAEDARQFGIVITRDDEEISSDLPILIDKLGTGSLWMEMWSRGVSEAEDPWRAIGAVIERLLEMRQSITFVLERIPTRAAEMSHLDSEQVLMLMSEDADRWLDRLAPLLTRFGERVRRWQLGPTGSNAAFEHIAPVEVAGKVRDALFSLIPRPVVVLPWVADQSVEGTGLEVANILLPRDLPSESIEPLVRTWRDIPDVALIIQSPDAERYGISAAGVDLAKRAILAWEAGVGVMGTESPWEWRTGRLREAMPKPIYPIWRTLTAMLAGREPVGELSGTTGLRVIIAGPGNSRSAPKRAGLLVAWNESADPENAVLRGYLGAGRITVRDLYANTREISLVDGEHAIPLTSEPIFIEGVDTTLLRFRAGLRLEPRFIELRAERTEAELIIENPWRTSISGLIRLEHPDDWQVTPRSAQFVVPGGESLRIPLLLTLGLHHESGTKTLRAHVTISGERNYPAGLIMPIEVELGLEGLLVNPAYKFVAREDGGPEDLVVTVMVTNIGDRARMLEILAGAPGFPRKDLMLTELPPGQAVVRRFLFENASETVRGQRVGISVREREGTGRWNTRIEIR